MYVITNAETGEHYAARRTLKQVADLLWVRTDRLIERYNEDGYFEIDGFAVLFDPTEHKPFTRFADL